MAARPNNRSPSPLSSRPMLVNPNPRISETNPTNRRSFSGPKPSFLTNPRRLDPTTPANSPSDFAARRSVGREGIAPHLRECEEKENDEKENALRASKLQSPAKGCKNFMAPTISAASKFTPSPRKKVLVERNDPVRTSISFSDGKAMFFSQDSELKSELGSDSNLADSKIKKAAVEVHPVSKPCKKVTFSEIPSEFEYSLSYESVITDSDSLNLVPPPSPIAPLDADPSLPPYDPKTNYLSPRPQFIRYRPNPRVEILKTLDPKEFDDTLMAEIMSEGLSDTDEGTDESLDKEEIADMVIGMDEEIVEARVAESLPVSTTPVDEEEVEEEAVVNNEKKSRDLLLPLSRFMCFSMILLLLVAGVSVSVRHAPPSFDQLLIKDLSFANLSRIYEQSRVVAVASARLSFEGVHNVSAKLVSLILKLVNEVVGGGEKQVVPLKFMNLTDLDENSWKEEGYFLKRVENLEYEEDDLDGEMEYEFEEDEYADEEGVVVVEDDGETDALEEYADEKEEEYAVAEEADSVMATRETVEEEFAHSEFQEADSVVATVEEEVARLESEYAAAADSQTTHQVEEAAAVVMEEEKSQAHVKVGASDDAEKSLSSPMAEATPAQVRSLGLAVVACSVFAAVVGAAALAFVYENKRRIKEREDNNGVLLSSSMSKSKGMEQPIIHQEKEISERWETESEMSSSYHQSRSYANKTTARKYSRRESLASSSGGGGGGSPSPSPSPSYGSFTTYERIPVKINNGYGEDEIITPVRRSSRIRNQVTSPAV